MPPKLSVDRETISPRASMMTLRIERQTITAGIGADATLAPAGDGSLAHRLKKPVQLHRQPVGNDRRVDLDGAIQKLKSFPR